jgi:non-lysosomal glucosylceramidase
MERLLWNGEYYNLWIDPVSGRRNEYCMADQLSGQLYVTLLGLDDILPREHLLSALSAIFHYNRAAEASPWPKCRRGASAAGLMP